MEKVIKESISFDKIFETPGYSRVFFAATRMYSGSAMDLTVAKDVLAAGLSESQVRDALQLFDSYNLLETDPAGTFKVTEKGLRLARELTHKLP